MSTSSLNGIFSSFSSDSNSSSFIKTALKLLLETNAYFTLLITSYTFSILPFPINLYLKNFLGVIFPIPSKASNVILSIQPQFL